MFRALMFSPDFTGGAFVSPDDVNNRVSARNVYPRVEAPTIGQRATAMTPFATGAYSQSPKGGNAPVTDDGAMNGGAVTNGNGVLGQPLTWWIVLAGLLVALMFFAKRAGQATEFSNIRLSFYNILTIALAAAVGIGALKVLFSRVPVPGLSTFIQAL